MPRRVITSSLITLCVTLSGCDQSPQGSTSSSSDIAAQDARWDDRSVAELRKAIDQRAAHGLDHMQFAAQGDPATAKGQAALTKNALRYASALAQGASAPGKLFDIYSVPRPSGDLHGGLAQALAKGKLADWLDSLAPADDNYAKLSQAYLALRKADDGGAPVIPIAAEPLKPGETDARVPGIVHQLVAAGYLQRPSSGNSYGPDMVQAVKRMQADYGTDPDGVIGADALEILNMSDIEKAKALAIAMERMRWQMRNPPATRIDVNLASAVLTYWRDGKAADNRKVVVGKPETETPQLGSPIYRLVANPTWTVPRSIQSKEIAGKGVGYLRRNNMAWKDGWIVQQPGPQNSLGLVKFDMQNEHQIYLHDTPAKQLFGEVQRQRSHGCVRVEDALGFAEMIARDAGVADQWQAARATGKETFVPLPRQIPVRLFYQTVLFDDKGEPVIRADPYGWNERVGTALGFAKSKSYRLRPAGDDVGP